MRALFGTGEGRAMLRGCGQQLNVVVHRVPDQGGTRKCVDLTVLPIC